MPIVTHRPGLQQGHTSDRAFDALSDALADPLTDPLQLKEDPKVEHEVEDPKVEDDKVEDDKVKVDKEPKLSFADLKAELKKAKSSKDPKAKTKFLEYFSKHYAPMLTGEVEFFQFLASKIAYMKLSVGDEISGMAINTMQNLEQWENAKGVQKHVNATDGATDYDSKYGSTYVLDRNYNNDAGLNAQLFLPKDKDTSLNAVVMFRGTGGDELAKKKGHATGKLADLDPIGVGFTAFSKGKEAMQEWVEVVKDYGRVTITGHSLGGAMAERFYALAAKTCPEKLRLVTYQGAAIDQYTASQVRGKDDPRLKGAKSTRVVGRGDVVPYGGAAHAPSDKIKYTSDKKGPVKKHVQTDLAEDMINKALDDSADTIYKDVVLTHNKGKYSVKRTLSESVRFVGGIIGGTIRTVLAPHKVIKALFSKGKQEK